MACTIFLYGSSGLQPVMDHTIQVLAVDVLTHQNVAVELNERISSTEWGARLKFQPADFVYLVAIHDFGKNYGPNTLEDLNGSVHARFDVVLFPLPKGKPITGTPPTNAQSIAAFIDSQSWTAAERRGLRNVIRAARSAKNIRDPYLAGMVDEWGNMLAQYRIDPGLV